ncbi:hypothetical protein FKP32DRAFT_1633655, partial [Trametes sanguinea]
GQTRGERPRLHDGRGRPDLETGEDGGTSEQRPTRKHHRVAPRLGHGGTPRESKDAGVDPAVVLVAINPEGRPSVRQGLRDLSADKNRPSTSSRAVTSQSHRQLELGVHLCRHDHGTAGVPRIQCNLDGLLHEVKGLHPYSVYQRAVGGGIREPTRETRSGSPRLAETDHFGSGPAVRSAPHGR